MDKKITGIIFIHLITFCLLTWTYSDISEISAMNKPEYDGTYEDYNSIGNFSELSTIKCIRKCLSDKRCISTFYNNITNVCILHSDPFVYTVRTKFGCGWRFYRITEHNGRCTDEWFYYRQLDLCYQFGPKIPSTNNDVAKTCNGSGEELIRVNSEERQEYMKLITADIGLVYPHSICIQGTNTVHTYQKWTYNDGTLMTYFSWGNIEPNKSAAYIRVKRNANYEWKAGPNTSDYFCTYICEHR